MFLGGKNPTICFYTCFISRFAALYPTPPGFSVPIAMATLGGGGGWCHHGRLPHRRAQPDGLFMNLHVSTRPTEILFLTNFYFPKGQHFKKIITLFRAFGLKKPKSKKAEVRHHREQAIH